MTREYEHLVMAICAKESAPMTSYMRLPHPSGIAVDPTRGVIYIASTRNPNQVYEMEPVSGLMPRPDVDAGQKVGSPLVPVRSRFLPGCLYIHDLALIGGVLHANAVGLNAVVRMQQDSGLHSVWWPRCIEAGGKPQFDRNYIQLNSIAAGPDLEGSYFTASTDKISARRPGHRNFSVNKRGVIFSGATREPMTRGLTRPHSARLYNGRLWVDDSGYGRVGMIENGRFQTVAGLPGWTRGLCLHEGIAFVGTSRVLPRFRQYAPGLNLESSVCGIHAIDVKSGNVIGSLIWPQGNQIFAIEWVDSTITSGFPFVTGVKRDMSKERELFYAFQTRSFPGVEI